MNCRRGAATWFVSLIFAAAFVLLTANASELEKSPGIQWVRWASFEELCDGDCSIAVYGGSFLETDMREVFGGIFGANRFVPPHQWNIRNDDGIIAAAFSRRLANIGGVLDFEGELGAAQRLGHDTASEGWVALYARWTYFPWNKWIITTAAVSMGFSYASEVSDLELKQGRRGTSGSRLLNFQSPELTLALPDAPETELVIRLHHRSGGREIVGKISYFKGTAGGSQYITVGVRRRF